ncbi:hypothetical protein D5S17_14735 [Pseudonocardiaceae bacterium YIM PH 21723]|nr:hypothetical protein D5S17_14735 [Pseudonocardiaceae bacterium YIM PH 21723]
MLISEKRATAQRPAVPRKRRWWVVGLGVALVGASVLGTQTYLSARDARVPVVLVVRDVSWGHAITAADLGTTDVVTGPELKVIRAADRDQLIGRTAKTGLVGGSLLTTDQLQDQPVPGPRQVLVGIPAKPGQLPARGLRAEEPVMVTPIGNSVANTSGTSVSATVFEVSAPDANGVVIVDIVVPAELAGTVTPAAAGGAVLALVGPR